MAVTVLGTRQLRDELASVLDALGELEEVVITTSSSSPSASRTDASSSRSWRVPRTVTAMVRKSVPSTVRYRAPRETAKSEQLGGSRVTGEASVREKYVSEPV